MAREDYKHRSIGVPLFYIFLIASAVLGIFDEALIGSGMLVIAAIGIVIVMALTLFKLIDTTDGYIAIFTIWALGFIGALSFMAAVVCIAIIALLKNKFDRIGIKSLPILTIYLICIVAIFFLYLGAVALRI